MRDFHFDLCIKSFIPKIFAKQELSVIRKRETRVMSFDRTKARFYEVLRSRGLEQYPTSNPLQISLSKMANPDNNYGLRYTAYNWSKNIPPLSQKETSTQANDGLDLLPWSQDEHNHNREVSSQTPPMPQFSAYNKEKIRNFIKLNTSKEKRELECMFK